MKVKISEKHLAIDKAQSTIITVVAAATIVTVFSLMSSKALLAKAAYQSKVISARQKSAAQLDKNVKDAQTFLDQYNNVFNGSSATNIIGGKNTKSADAKPPDGSNPRIVLDALPTSYDFPALVTSVAGILADNNVASPSIAGLDSSVSTNSQPSANPQPGQIPLTITGTTTYGGAENLIKDLERSIRPFDVTKVSISGSQAISVNLDVNTYYQPAKILTITSKAVN
jgi:hypothetical protein